jgi:phage/plasmid-associated DNA primase
MRINGFDEEWIKWVQKISYTKQLIEQLKTLCEPKELDTNPYLLGFENGVYDLKSCEFRIGKIDDFISMKCSSHSKIKLSVCPIGKMSPDKLINLENCTPLWNKNLLNNSR